MAILNKVVTVIQSLKSEECKKPNTAYEILRSFSSPLRIFTFFSVLINWHSGCLYLVPTTTFQRVEMNLIGCRGRQLHDVACQCLIMLLA